MPAPHIGQRLIEGGGGGRATHADRLQRMKRFNQPQTVHGDGPLPARGAIVRRHDEQGRKIEARRALQLLDSTGEPFSQVRFGKSPAVRAAPSQRFCRKAARESLATQRVCASI